MHIVDLMHITSGARSAEIFEVKVLILLVSQKFYLTNQQNKVLKVHVTQSGHCHTVEFIMYY